EPYRGPRQATLLMLPVIEVVITFDLKGLLFSIPNGTDTLECYQIFSFYNNTNSEVNQPSALQ
nr:hypothetical protein [Thermoproteota archaeon]